ncbi:hypothetical protein [Bradyrhizobium oligotrophicum]|uniref:hypothetical protein n=1 Tax=Bradyrhizobium oligotrophicum TaxID=44255 RepID=UPI001360B42C|nr:hypothetical protein [Bradyrhizobium oligotrophicum]
MRTPIDLDLVGIQSVTPFAERVRRQLRGRGVARMPIQLKFIASTCIAQNAWDARLRTSGVTVNLLCFCFRSVVSRSSRARRNSV